MKNTSSFTGRIEKQERCWLWWVCTWKMICFTCAPYILLSCVIQLYVDDDDDDGWKRGGDPSEDKGTFDALGCDAYCESEITQFLKLGEDKLSFSLTLMFSLTVLFVDQFQFHLTVFTRWSAIMNFNETRFKALTWVQSFNHY